MQVEVGERFMNWIILDSKRISNKKYLCRCMHCGTEKAVSFPQLFDKRVDRNSINTKCRDCTKLPVGSRYQTNKGFWYTIKEYVSATNITIQFDPDDLCPEGYVRKVVKCYILDGVIDYPFERSCAGVGYMGLGVEYDGDDHIRDVWSKMIQRCYKPSSKDRKGYIGCTVCGEWHSYTNFYQWYSEQIDTGLYENGYQLDKDLIKMGNKVYCPEYCRLVPEKINSFLNNFEDTRSTGTPNGVNWKERNKKYQVSIKDEYSKNKYLCITDDVAHGYEVYRTEKERIAKVLADRYSGTVNADIINVLYNFKCPEWDFDKKKYKPLDNHHTL